MVKFNRVKIMKKSGYDMLLANAMQRWGKCQTGLEITMEARNQDFIKISSRCLLIRCVFNGDGPALAFR